MNNIFIRNISERKEKRICASSELHLTMHPNLFIIIHAFYDRIKIKKTDILIVFEFNRDYKKEASISFPGKKIFFCKENDSDTYLVEFLPTFYLQFITFITVESQSHLFHRKEGKVFFNTSFYLS